MITRFDHVVIGVQKLEEALESYTKLGFEVFEGGRHPSLGTRNAIIRFGLDYIELLEIEHEEIARKNGFRTMQEMGHDLLLSGDLSFKEYDRVIQTDIG